jgi:hypothetical protein
MLTLVDEDELESRKHLRFAPTDVS